MSKRSYAEEVELDNAQAEIDSLEAKLGEQRERTTLLLEALVRLLNEVDAAGELFNYDDAWEQACIAIARARKVE